MGVCTYIHIYVYIHKEVYIQHICTYIYIPVQKDKNYTVYIVFHEFYVRM